ncbi:D-glycero-beta-D-manno-heptose 1,7-bisphosphate 7-phosphatase [Leptolyngbya sp. AN03gr2]|uniref:D-glycero-beta-D-manno-heptose 1,7-bisphosphate 7-phosphatase n=1 Tax=unclassified Leptolyngbya TaxID=2650499 RepID=UPI003D319C4C
MKALFLDRDGVINQENGYVYRIEDFQFIDGVFETCAFFQRQNYLLIVITNQAGIARGYYSEAEFHTLNTWMIQQFLDRGIEIAQTYYCPNHPTHGIGQYRQACQDRKPHPGMLLRAQRDWGIDLEQSILVGDKESDIQAGLAAQVGLNVLVRSGHPIDELNTQANAVIDSIRDLPQWVSQPLMSFGKQSTLAGH